MHSSICGERETLAALESGGLHASVIARRRGPLGPRLAARADWLRDRDLLGPRDDHEELLIFRAQY